MPYPDATARMELSPRGIGRVTDDGTLRAISLRQRLFGDAKVFSELRRPGLECGVTLVYHPWYGLCSGLGICRTLSWWVSTLGG